MFSTIIWFRLRRVGCEVGGVMPLAFQWFVNTTNLISDATNAILQLTNVQWSQAGAYTLVASNCYGSATSSPAILTVTVSPVIVSSPTNRMTRTGDTVDFSVETVGALPLACQWFFGTNAILQATNSILYLTNVQPRQSGAYSVVITNIYGAVTSALALLEFTVTVTNCTEANLRAAMAGCGMVSFASDGTITLTSTITNSVNTILDATGHQITISGGNRARVFVVGTNATLTLNHLTIANGGGDGDGGNGGALLNMGTVNATDCTFRNNTPYTQAACYGGAIYNDVGGTMSLDSCRFTNNSAIGSSSGAFLAGDGAGGAIFNNGALVVRQSDFAGNKANGGGNLSMWGSSGGNGFGGAICNAGTLLLDSCTIENNTAQGGNGTGGVTGGNGGAGGAGGSGGSGLGGALCNYGTATAVNTTFVGNGGYGGYGMYGGIGGYGMYGGIGGNSAILGGNGGNGGPGGNGGDGFGAIYSIGQLLLTNCTLASNSGVAGSGGPAGRVARVEELVTLALRARRVAAVTEQAA